MKIGKLKTQKRREDFNWRTYKVAGYGEKNDYPDRIREVFAASTTGAGCLATDTRFTFGEGFNDPVLAGYVMNRKGQTGNTVLRKVIEDARMHGGFALHANYNAIFEAVEIQHLPFETVRIGVTEKGVPNNLLATHPDWNRTNKLLNMPLNNENIKRFGVFNPDPRVIRDQIREAGGISNWNGQILYFSTEGDLVYPLSPYDPAITDMSTEESISTVLHRNAKHNFLPAGMLIRKKGQQQTTDENNEEREDPDDGFADEVTKWQGDEAAGKMIVADINFDEEAPQFVPFNVQNFDRMFDSTKNFIQDNIGRIFMQPPILRGVDVGAGFGADLMKNAYDFYNSIVESERKTIEEAILPLLMLLPATFTDYTIKPLQYQIQATDGQLDKQE